MGRKPKTTHNELEELREELEELRKENKQLRKTVADLSELTLAEIVGIELVPKPNEDGSDGSASPR